MEHSLQVRICGFFLILLLFRQRLLILCFRVDLDPTLSMIMPGEHSDVYITLLNKMVLDIGQPFTIRENGKTVATGIITGLLSNVQVSKNNLSKITVSETS